MRAIRLYKILRTRMTPRLRMSWWMGIITAMEMRPRREARDETGRRTRRRSSLSVQRRLAPLMRVMTPARHVACNCDSSFTETALVLSTLRVFTLAEWALNDDLLPMVTRWAWHQVEYTASSRWRGRSKLGPRPKALSHILSRKRTDWMIGAKVF